MGKEGNSIHQVMKRCNDGRAICISAHRKKSIADKKLKLLRDK